MGSVPILVWVLVLVIVVLMAMLLSMALALRALRRDLRALDSSLDKLNSRLDEQEARLEEIRRQVASASSDPLTQFSELFKAVRSKGLVSALLMFGAGAFRTYLGRRRRKALPKGN